MNVQESFDKFIEKHWGTKMLKNTVEVSAIPAEKTKRKRTTKKEQILFM